MDVCRTVRSERTVPCGTYSDYVSMYCTVSRKIQQPSVKRVAMQSMHNTQYGMSKFSNRLLRLLLVATVDYPPDFQEAIIIVT